jgi:hypothetical protein
MKKTIFTALLLGIALMAYSQRGMRGDQENRHERMKAMKVAYITNQLDLSSEEAAKFWPVYNQIEAKRQELRDEDIIPENINELSEKDSDALINKIMQNREKNLELDKKLVKDLEKVISKKKIALLFSSEHQFRREMASTIKTRMENRESRGQKRMMIREN